MRINPDGITTRIIPFNLEKLLREKSVNIEFEPGDKIYIYKGDVEKVLDKTVRIEGEVRNPGQYPLSSIMTPMDRSYSTGWWIQ